MEMLMRTNRYLQALEQQFTVATQPYQQQERVTIRQAQTEDARPLVEMHQRLSANSLYYRYLRPYTPTVAEMVNICDLLPQEGATWVAVAAAPQPVLVGMAYYVRYPHQPDTAEPAIVVEDAYLGQGIGRQLYTRLAWCALADGVCFFEALVHPANYRVLHLLRDSGTLVSEKLDFGIREVRIQLQGQTK